MSLGLRLASMSRWKLGAVAFGLGALVAAIAYQVPTSLDVDLGDGVWSALATEGFHDAEGSYRWTRARSTIAFVDPGARSDVVLEVFLSGFRPRDAEPPLLVLEAGGRSLRAHPSRRVERYGLPTKTEGLWSSTLEVSLRADTFTPGGGDDRALGVRVHRARLELGAGALPPLRQLLAAGALALFLFLWHTGSRGASAAFAVALAFSLAVGLGYGWLRLQTALTVPFLSAVFGLTLALRWLKPAFVAFVSEAAQRASRTAVDAVRVAARWSLLPGAIATAGLVAATVLVPRFEIDLGSGEAAPIAERFGSADGDSQGVRFRQARSDASLALGDFGWGHPWQVGLRARLDSGSPARGILVRIDEQDLVAALSDTWTVFETAVPSPPASWRRGPVLVFPGMGAGTRLEVASVRVDRGRSLPSPRTLGFVLLATAALLAALSATGLPAATAALAAAAGALLLDLAIGLSPVVVTPFVPTLALGCLAGALLAAGARGVLDGLAVRRLVPELPGAALATGVAAFVLWFTASASPLYLGGHFGYHSSVAEEIWKGGFLLYYLPGPDNMLARQPQWGDLLVPHPCLFHTLASPFAALPPHGFAIATKLFLAWLLFGVAVVAGLVAETLGSRRAAVLAVALVAVSPVGYQLLGLGHLMTILGCWAGALALGFLILHLDRLSERRIFLGALGLLALCFVSYTGSLLFGSFCLLLTSALLSRTERATAARLGALVGLAWGLALLLYYGNWVVPFLTQSIPALLSPATSGGATDLWARLASEPRKLDYTFGSFLIPLVGLCGVSLARGPRRLFLGAWAGVLVLFSVVDIRFNFLLKHHYFSLPAIAVGAALVSDRFAKKSLWTRGVLLLIFGLLCWLGLREALATARGGA